MDEPPYHLEIEGLDESGQSTDLNNSLRGRPWVGIHFECCSVYSRIYRNKEGTRYHGYCPRCTRKVSLRVGTGGTDSRFFSAE